MFIPLNVIRAFQKKPNLKPLPAKAKESENVKKEYCPIGYNRCRTSTLISKPTRKKKGNLVNAYYKNTSPEFDEEQRLAKFRIFKNLFKE
jgi:hypothetical protein